MKVYVNYNDNRWKKYKIDFTRIARAAAPRHPQAEVSIILTDDTEIRTLNRVHRNIDKPTNVLSFELGDDILLGDIYIALDTVIREAKEMGISVAKHTAHMVVHGMLHLQGFDHITDEEAIQMETKEVKILKSLNIKNPYAADSAVHTKKHKFGLLSYISYFLCGAICALGFAPFNFWWATIIGFAITYIMARCDANKMGFWRLFGRVSMFGAAYAMAMFWWALHSIYVVPELTKQFAIWTVPGLLGIGLAGAIFFPWPFVASARMRINSAARPFIFAGVGALILWLREWIFTGFPWNPLANITMPYAMVSNSMSLWGALGLTFVIMGLIASVAELVWYRKWRNIAVFAFFVLAFIGGIFAGRENIKFTELKPDTDVPMIRIVQPARNQSQKISYSHEDAVERAEKNIKDLYNLGRIADKPDLIVYPETTYPFVITDGMMPLARALGVGTIIGSTTYDDGAVFNSMVVSDDMGVITNVYNKSHLVPFGEYSPFGIMPAPVNLASGNGPEIISIDINGYEFNFAPAICYEIIFSDSLIPANVKNIDAIINITNDTWFGQTPGVYQHLDMVRRYAIESGIPVIRANYSGISAFVLPDGEIVASLPVGETGVVDSMVWGAHQTPYRTIGRNMIMIILLLIAVVGVYVFRTRQE